MANLREQDLWTDQIYLIERSDPLMGGEYGINNIQARQLACRTVWLLSRFLTSHAPDGSHTISPAQIAECANILERKLCLDFSTRPIGDELTRLGQVLQEQLSAIDGLLNLENSVYGPLYEALKLSWQFGYPRYAFEFFNPLFSLRPNFLPLEIIETIRGDDSIDVMDSETLEPGSTYVLWDRGENRSEFVTVKEILTDKRVILCHSEEVTRLGRGVLAAASWQPGPRGLMTAAAGSKYVSRKIDLFAGMPGARLVIAHTGETDFLVELKYPDLAPCGNWLRLPLVARERNGEIWKSAWQVPGCSFTFRITVQNDCEIEHLALVSEHAANSISAVRTPRVVDDDFTIDRYGALYGIPHAATLFEISKNADFRSGCQCLEFGPEKSALPVWDYRLRVLSKMEPPASGLPFWWRARYRAQNGDLSGFSTLGRYVQP